MIDKAISVGAAFDWITPLVTIVRNYRNRPSVGYNVPVDGGWSAYAVSGLLKEYGIKHWGLCIFQDTIMFRLRLGQAEFAQYLFDQNGIPYSGGSNIEADRKHRRRSERLREGHGETAPVAAPANAQQWSLNGLLDDSLHSINHFVGKLPGG
jgi:hypothetical protein